MRVTPHPAFVQRVSARRGALDFAPTLGPLQLEKVWASVRQHTSGVRRSAVEVQTAAAMIDAGKLPDPYDLHSVALAERMVYRHYQPTENDTFVRLVAETQGVAAMVAMKLESNAIKLSNDMELVTFDSDEPGHYDLSWHVARTIVCRADDASYLAAREVAARWRADRPPERRVLADFLFCSELEWANADLDDLIALFPTALHRVGFRAMTLLAVTNDPIRANKVVEALEGWAIASLCDKFACDIVVGLPPAEATRVLCTVLKKAKGIGKTQLAGLGAAMCALEGEEMAAELAGLLLHSPIGPMAADYFRRFPKLARAVLPKVAAGTSKAADAARSILAASAPKEDIPLAEGDEIPKALREAPWRKKKKSKPLVLETLPALPKTTIEWADGERERVIEETKKWYAHDLADMTWEMTAEWERLPRERRPVDVWIRWGAQRGTFRVPDRESLAEWNDNASATVYLGPLRMLARYGGQALRGLFLRDAFAPYAGDSFFEAQLHAICPESARVAAEALTRRKAWRRRAQDWIASHAEMVARALLPAALGTEGKDRKLAENAVRIAARAHVDAVMNVARELGADAERAVRELVDRDPLTDLEVKGKLPPFLRVEDLPPLLTRNGKRLPGEAVVAFLEILRGTSPDAPYAGLDSIREATGEASLGDFAWALVQAWILAGAKGTFDWIPMSLAMIGDDACARRLAPYVRDWSRKDAKKAKLAIDVLSAIGTSTALLHLSYVADKARFEEAKTYARETLERVAAQQGLTTDELADRTVPDLDLDADGTATLDFGPRKFTVTFDEGLRPVVKGEDGARLATFPRANKNDDAAAAKAATARFKGLKADAEAVAQALLRRLEAAMVRGRAWHADAFRTYVIGHPLVTHVARRLVWSDNDGQAFRVAEDGSLADDKDAQYTLAAGATVTLPHPLLLGKDAVAAWSRILADYAIVQPFEQLARATFAPSEAEAGAKTLARFEGRKSKAGPLMGSLEARGWQRWPDETSLSSAGKTLRTRGGTEATVSLTFSPGIDLGDVAGSPEQTLHAPSLSGAPAFKDIDDVDFSELVRDLEAIAH